MSRVNWLRWRHRLQRCWLLPSFLLRLLLGWMVRLIAASLSVTSLVLLLLASWLLFTEAGGSWALRQIPGVELTGFEGQLAHRWQVDQLQWEASALDLALPFSALDISDLHIEWDLSCLLQRTACLRSIQIHHLQITRPDHPAPTPAASDAPLLGLPQLEPLSLGDLHLPLNIQLDHLLIQQLSWNQTQLSDGIQLSASWQQDQLRIAQLQLSSPLWPSDLAALELTGELQPQQRWPLHATLTSHYQGHALTLEAHGALLDFLHLDLQDQQQQLHVWAEIDLQRQHWPLALELQAQELELTPWAIHFWPQAPLEKLTLNQLQLSLRGHAGQGWHLDSQGQWLIDQLPLNHQLALTLDTEFLWLDDLALSWSETGRIALQGQSHWASWRQDHWPETQLQLQLLELSQLLATSPVDGFLASAPLTSEQVTQLQDVLPKVDDQLHLQAQWQHQQLSAQAELTGSWASNQTWSLQSRASLLWSAEEPEAYQLTLDFIQLAQADQSLLLSASFNQHQWRTSFDLDWLRLEDLPWLEMQGDLTLEGQINAPAWPLFPLQALEQSTALAWLAETELQTTLTSHQLHWQDWQLEGLTWNQVWQARRPTLPLMLELNLASLRQQEAAQSSQPLSFETLRFALEGEPSAHQLHLALTYEDQPLSLHFAGGWQTGPQLHYMSSPIQLEDWAFLWPEDFRWEGQLEAHLVAAWDEFLALSLALDAPASQFQVLSEDPLNATPLWLTFAYQELHLDLHLLRDALTSRFWLQGPELGELRLDSRMDRSSSGDLLLDAQVSVQDMQLLLLAPFIELDELTGQLEGDIYLRGPLRQPELFGELRLEQVSAQDRLWPTALSQLEAELTLDGDHAWLEGQYLTSPSGTGAFNGQIRWRPEWEALLTLEGNNLALRFDPYGQVVANSQLQLEANTTQAHLSGDIHLPRGLIEVRGLPAQAQKISSDARVIGPAAPPPSASFPFTMDLDLRLGPDQLLLEALGLEAGVSGRLRVTQDQQVRGELSLVDGVYQSFGQDLQLRRARLTFTGPADLPFVDIEAIRSVGEVTAGVRVTGRIDQLETEIFSEPALAPEEALAYLVLGRPLQTERDENALNTAALSLGLSGASGLTERLGSALGIREFELATEGDGSQASLVASGYLNSRLSVSYGVGIYEEISRFAVRYEFSRRFYVEAVSSIESSLDFFWRIDY